MFFLQIRKLNKRIVKFGESLFMFSLTKLRTMRNKADELVTEKEQVFAEIIGSMKKAGKSNDNEAGPSGTKNKKKRGAPV